MSNTSINRPGEITQLKVNRASEPVSLGMFVIQEDHFCEIADCQLQRACLDRRLGADQVDLQGGLKLNQP